jgi:hypothetical protein
MLLRHTALRISDVCTLSREAISRDRDTWRIWLRTLKSDEPVYLPIPERLNQFWMRFHYRGTPRKIARITFGTAKARGGRSSEARSGRSPAFSRNLASRMPTHTGGRTILIGLCSNTSERCKHCVGHKFVTRKNEDPKLIMHLDLMWCGEGTCSPPIIDNRALRISKHTELPEYWDWLHGTACHSGIILRHENCGACQQTTAGAKRRRLPEGIFKSFRPRLNTSALPSRISRTGYSGPFSSAGYR